LRNEFLELKKQGKGKIWCSDNVNNNEITNQDLENKILKEEKEEQEIIKKKVFVVGTLTGRVINKLQLLGFNCEIVGESEVLFFLFIYILL